MQHDPEQVSNTLLKHLEREEDALRGSLDVLGKVRTALLASDVPQLVALHKTQERFVARSARLSQERDDLRTRLATVCGVSADRVSLSTIANTLPVSQRNSLRATGERIRRLAGEVDGLVRSNAALAASLLRFTRRFLLDITGGEEAAAGYGPDGTHREASFGSLLSTRG